MPNELTPFYTFSQFLQEDLATWGNKLVKHHENCMNEAPSREQKVAWKNCFEFLQDVLAPFSQLPGEIIFEYELPRERGRRPDVVLLLQHQVLILEFKDKSTAKQADFEQALNYRRDIASYHSASHELEMTAALVVTKGAASRQKDNIHIVGKEGLRDLLNDLIQESIVSPKKFCKGLDKCGLRGVAKHYRICKNSISRRDISFYQEGPKCRYSPNYFTIKNPG